MTEEEKDQATGQEPVSSAESPSAATPTDEGTAGAIPMPAGPTADSPSPEANVPPAADTEPTPLETPAPASASDTSLPQQPVTPPQGVPQSVPPGAPTGGYAMGALAGNPMLGTPPPYHYGGQPNQYGGPPTDPNAPFWPTPPAGATRGHRDNRLRNGLIAGGAALVVLAAGIGIGHATWNNGTQIPSAASNNNFPPHNNGSNPFQIVPGNSGSTGNGNGNANSGSSSSGSSGPSDVNAIAEKVDPGLVDINTSLGYQQEQAAGTGIVVTSDGEILTNNHVINGATSISVTDVGNHKTYTASVVGYDRTGDIAVLQLHNASGLQTANFGNSSSISVGEDVVGVGNAGGTGGTPSAAGGTVTALNQSITAQDSGDGTSEQLQGLIETNANIQPGDSGGALVNSSGQVLGVDTAASAGFSFQYNGENQGNQGFAIPINTALSIARQIEAGKGSTTIHIGTTAFLGVEISPNGSSSSTGSGSGSSGGDPFGPFGGLFGNSGSTGNTGNSGDSGSSASGAAVAGVVTSGPAQEAGIAQGDVITTLGGKTITSADDLTRDMGIYHPGDKVQVGWTDANGQTHTATVQLSSGPPQ
jgi:S1-C subfamily serine protease